MKYIKDYDFFIKESKKVIQNKSKLVEKQLFTKYSKNFWGLSLSSNVFSIEEKSFIKNNLMDYKVDLLKEEWDWLNNVIKSAKNTKLVKFISNKIKAIRDGLSSFAKSISKFAQDIVIKIISWVTNSDLWKKYIGKVNDDLKKEIEEKTKQNPEESTNEVKCLKKTIGFWIKGEGGDSEKNIISNEIKNSEPSIEKEIESNLESAEESSDEVLSSGQRKSQEEAQVSESNDILMSFYKFELIREGSDGGQRKGLTGWLLDFLDQPKLDPEAKTGKKLLWWGKLFLNVLSKCLNPAMTLIEKAIKSLSNNFLQLKSWVTSAFGGPPNEESKNTAKSQSGVLYYKYLILGGIAAGVAGLIGDISAGIEYGTKFVEKAVFKSKHPHGTGSEFLKALTSNAFGFVKDWMVNVLNYLFDEKIKNFKYLIKTIMTAFCVAMIIYHITHEFDHLKHSH